eukprot:6183582-Pleurochrysis_carterae.AAC.10
MIPLADVSAGASRRPFLASLSASFRNRILHPAALSRQQTPAVCPLRRLRKPGAHALLVQALQSANFHRTSQH